MSRRTRIPQLTHLIDGFTRLVEREEAAVFEQEEFSALTGTLRAHLEVIARLGHPTLTEIARALHLTKPSVTALVDKLAERGFLRKVRSDADRRSVHVHLTPLAERLEQQHAAAHARIAERLARSLPPEELATLVALLERALIGLRP